MMFDTKLLLYNFLILLISSILTLVVVTILPFILIYRVLVVKCAKYLRPDLESIVSGFDLLFAKDFRLWDTKPETTLAATITLKSSLRYDKVQSFFEGVIVEKKNEKLCQYIVPWMGFVFWKKETDFSLANHIFVIDEENGEIQDNKWLDNFTKKLFKKPYGKMQSPWDIYIISSYQPTPGSKNQSAFIFRHHHSLIDGHSYLKLFANAYDNYMPIKYESSNKGMSYSGIRIFTSWLSTPYKVLKYSLDTTDWNKKLWNKLSREICSGFVMIPMEKILLIRQKYTVGVNAIFYAGVTAAFRNILLRSNSKIPETICMGAAIPKANHPDHLCNHYIGAPLALPVGISDPLERLVKINFDYDNFIASGLPEMMDRVEEILGLLPYLMLRWIGGVPFSSLVSIIPLGNQNEFLGCPIGEYHNSHPVPGSIMITGVLILGVLNNGRLHLRGTFDKNILASDQLAKEIMQGIDEYYDSLLID